MIFCCGRTADDGRTGTRGVLRGPRRPKKIGLTVVLLFKYGDDAHNESHSTASSINISIIIIIFSLKRYDLAAKCYRQALHCVKETPALGEREKASKTQEIQVAQMLIILVLMLMLMLRPPKVTEMLIVLE